MPAVKKFVEDYIGKQVEGGIDPMEAVAKGAAIQAGILGGDVQSKEILLLDVTPLNFGFGNFGRSAHSAHRSQHHHPDFQDPDIFHCGR